MYLGSKIVWLLLSQIECTFCHFCPFREVHTWKVSLLRVIILFHTACKITEEKNQDRVSSWGQHAVDETTEPPWTAAEPRMDAATHYPLWRYVSSWRCHPKPETLLHRFLGREPATNTVAVWCPTLCDSMDRSTPGFPVLHHLLEFAQTHVCWVSDAIQPI